MCSLGILLLALAVTLGCRDNADTPSPASAEASALDDAASLLRQAIERYQASPQYRDRGVLRLEYEAQGQPVVDESEVAIEFARPNRLRLSIARGINRLTIVSDGRNLWASVDDPVSNDLRHQVVQRPAPKRLTVSEVYSATEMLDPAQASQMQSVLLGLPLNLYTSQLGLCLPESALLDLLDRATKITSLEPAAIDSMDCDRVELSGAAGKHVFWIDRKARYIRRIEYPTTELFQLVPVEQRPQHVRLTLDIADPSFRPLDDDVFRFVADRSARAVQYFVLPPTPLPSRLLGQQIPEMTFVDLAGEVASNRHWAGKIQVLLWFDRHASSQVNVTRLEQNYRQSEQLRDRVVFRLICAEPPDELSTADVRQLVAQWGTSIPVLRDLEAAGRDALDISEAPTAVVLDATRSLHLFEVGANDQIDHAIQLVVGRLMAGENVAADVLRNSQAAEDRFQQQLQLASRQADAAGRDDNHPFAPAAEFRKLNAAKAWQIDDLDSPGNLLLIPPSARTPARLLALCAMRELVELDDGGRVTARHKLDLPDSAFIGQIGHAVDGHGAEFFWGFSQLGRYVYVFDSQFRKILQYPATDQQHNGVMDAELLDLDGDGQLELYVGFAAPHGCQRVKLSGERQWSNRSLPTTLSVTGRRISGFTQLFITGEDGSLLPIDADGRAGQPIAIGQSTIHQIESCGEDRPRPCHFMGMSYSIEGRLIAVGLSASLQEQWSYGLPAGVFRHQVQSPRWAPLWGADQGAWLLAGPDGSVHVVRDDGRFFDHMNTGTNVLGIAGHAGTDGRGRLYLTTPGAISAYDLSAAK
jgi:hypothetical protein